MPRSGPLEDVSARRWLTRVMGGNSWRVVWEPLLRGKFHDAADDVSMAWLWARIHDRTRQRHHQPCQISRPSFFLSSHEPGP